jgi:hypothetical protein
MNDAVRRDIEALRKLTMTALRAKYLELLGEASRSSNRDYLFRRVAWRLQAIAAGDLSEQARERARELARDADLRLRAPATFWQELEQKRSSVPRDARIPLAGTELIREYKGRQVRVIVVEHGFEYRGRQYDSLSAIASHVTGTRWNGFAFFRLNTAVKHG